MEPDDDDTVQDESGWYDDQDTEVEQKTEVDEDESSQEESFALLEQLYSVIGTRDEVDRNTAWEGLPQEVQDYARERGNEPGPAHFDREGATKVIEPTDSKFEAWYERVQTTIREPTSSLWLDSETREHELDLRATLNEHDCVGDARIAVESELADLVHAVKLHRGSLKAFGQVRSSKQGIGPDGRWYRTEYGAGAQKRTTRLSLTETRAMQDAALKGQDLTSLDRSPEFVAARKALESGEGSVASLFEQIPTQVEQQAFLKGLSAKQARALEDENR